MDQLLHLHETSQRLKHKMKRDHDSITIWIQGKQIIEVQISNSRPTGSGRLISISIVFDFTLGNKMIDPTTSLDSKLRGGRNLT